MDVVTPSRRAVATADRPNIAFGDNTTRQSRNTVLLMQRLMTRDGQSLASTDQLHSGRAAAPKHEAALAVRFRHHGVFGLPARRHHYPPGSKNLVPVLFCCLILMRIDPAYVVSDAGKTHVTQHPRFFGVPEIGLRGCAISLPTHITRQKPAYTARMQSLALYSSQMKRENSGAGSTTVFFRPAMVENAQQSQPESFFDLDRRSNTREEHAEFCEAVLREPHRFPSVPRYNYVPDFPLEVIYPKVIGTSEGRFPFVLSFPVDYSCEELTSELKAKFKAGRWYLKQNTSFTQLSNCNIERSTFQIVGRSDARRQNKISLYVSKLLGCNSQYILEFRRSGRDVKEIPCEFLIIKKRLSTNVGSLFKLPKVLIMPATREQQIRASEGRMQHHGYSSLTLFVGSLLRANNNTPFLQVEASPEVSAASVFRCVINSVDEAFSLEPSRKKIRVDDAAVEDLPKALWWDLRPIDPELTTSFEELIETIIRECNLHIRTGTMQDSFDLACLGLAKTFGPRISMLVIENSHLISQDISILGRWMTLQKCLNAQMSPTKVVLLNAQSQLDNLWLDTSLCTRVPAADPTPTVRHLSHDASSPTEEISSDMSSASAVEPAVSPFQPFETRNFETNWNQEMTWDGLDDIADGNRSALHPSLEVSYENFVASRKRKYEAFLNQQDSSLMGSVLLSGASGVDAELNPSYRLLQHSQALFAAHN
eukprot:TRINITY_DN3540_c0_g1_i1.p1 TRINITY_DN3540_c0_g1~~TRINITY_DN3540_c0_g1_i1.p1  ORF type:complete len:708 (-),score=66.04 TRINITY_DN3540_c0_g1_i1:71-2194(-)